MAIYIIKDFDEHFVLYAIMAINDFNIFKKTNVDVEVGICLDIDIIHITENIFFKVLIQNLRNIV